MSADYFDHLEAELRAAVPRAQADPARSWRRWRGRRPSIGGPAVAFSVAVAVAVAVAAIVLVGHHSLLGNNTAGTALPATQHDCAANRILRTEGRLVATAHGTVGGRSWTLQVDSARHGLQSVQAGRLLLGGRAYGFCDTGLDIELINAGPHGIVYGLAPRPYHPPIVIEAATDHGIRTGAYPRVHYYPAATRQVPDATLFVRALPTSACAYVRELGATARGRPNQSVVFGTNFTRSCPPGRLLHSPAGSAPAP